MMTLEVRQLHPLFAAEVSGIDLSAPIPADAKQALVDIIDRYSVVVFHGQKLDDDRLLALGQTFGHIEPPRNQRVHQRLKHAALADISNLTAENELRGQTDHRRLDALANQLWQSDASFRKVPGALSMLHAHVIPPSGGETEFADLRAAYDALPAEKKTRIENLVAEHSIFNSRGQLGHTDYTDAERASLPSVHHRVVRTHPGSKRKTLYLGAHASHIVGWPVPDGKLLIRDLMDHATQRPFVYRHNWRVGDLVIWDNRCTLHRGRPYEDGKHVRDLRRVTTQDIDGSAARAA